MRRMTQLLMSILLIIGLYIWLTPVIRDLWEKTQSSQYRSEQARASSYFPLEQDKWLTFDIANKSRLFRFYFHAALLPNNEEGNLRYRIKYQWLDGAGSLLAENIYHINTRRSPFLSVTSEKPLSSGQDQTLDTTNTDLNDPITELLPTRFYNHKRSEPSLDQSLYIFPVEHPQARQIRFQVHAMDIGIEQIGLRSYIRYIRDDQDVKVAWQRMNSIQKQAISAASVYPSFLLSEYERNNIMKAYWKPIGPQGILDDDYRIETLYLRENTAPTLPQEAIINDGLFASPEHWLTVKLKSPFSRYRIKWHGINPLQPSTPSFMQLHWQDANIKHQRRWQAEVKQHLWEGNLAKGLLQIIPNGRGIFKLYELKNAKWKDITPEKLRSRAYVCAPKTPLRFPLAPGKEEQSLKINAKSYYRSDQMLAHTSSRVELYTISKNGRVLEKDSLALKSQPNPYQQFNDTALVDSHVFESAYSYINASNQSKTLHIKCSAPVLISVSTRPWRHPISRILPRDRNFWHAYPKREPAWFSLQPKDVQQLITYKQYHSLIWHLQPIEENPAIASGQFTWQALSSQDPYALEKQLFTHHESDTPTRMEARASSFQPIKRSQQVIIAGKNAQATLRPSAVYLRDTNTPQSVYVWIDHKLVLTTTVVGKTGKIRLPHLKAGSHQIEFINGDEDIRWFVNNISQSKRSHLLRSAYPLLLDNSQVEQTATTKIVSLRAKKQSKNQQQFSITLPFSISGEGQKLAIWIFAPANISTLNCKLAVHSKRSKGSQDSHSFRHYNYTIASEDYPASYVLKQRDGLVHGPIPMFVQLNNDIPAQQANAELSCDQPNVLASAGIISAGLSSSYDFRERINAQ